MVTPAGNVRLLQKKQAIKTHLSFHHNSSHTLLHMIKIQFYGDDMFIHEALWIFLTFLLSCLCEYCVYPGPEKFTA